MPIKNVYLQIEELPDYSPVAPEEDHPPRYYKRDCMHNHGHEGHMIPEEEVNARRLDAVIYREYLDADYTIPNTRKIVWADINEPSWEHRVPGAVIYASPGDRLQIHVRNMHDVAHSFHIHGLRYGIDSDGAFSFGVQSLDDRRSDEICPGSNWTYIFDVDSTMLGVWPFHDHCLDIEKWINRGLIGCVIVRPSVLPNLSADVDNARLPLFNIAATNNGPVVQPVQQVPINDLIATDFNAMPWTVAQVEEDWGINLPNQFQPMPGNQFIPFPRKPYTIEVPLFIHMLAGDTANPLFDAVVEPAQVFDFHFHNVGEYDYLCTLHPQMTGHVSVQIGAPLDVQVSIVNFAFVPENIVVGAGGTVHWTNNAPINHTVTDLGGAAIPSTCLNGRAFTGNTPTILANAGQRIRWYVCNLDLGEHWHNFHLHGMRWTFAGETIDTRTIGPAESFVVDTTAPPVLSLPAHVQAYQSNPPVDAIRYLLSGDFIFHCHVEMHMHSGLVGIVRSKQVVWLREVDRIAMNLNLPYYNSSNLCPRVDHDRCHHHECGEWETLEGDPMVTQMHSILLRSGKVLYYGYTRYDQSRIYDPVTQTFSSPANQPGDVAPPQINPDIWCTEHSFQPDGTPIIHGGFTTGFKQTFYFNPTTLAWSFGTPNVSGRWYSTTIELGDGRSVTLYGVNEQFVVQQTMEFWNAGTWGTLTALPADWDYLYYPWVYLLPDGKLFIAGPQGTSRRFDIGNPAGAEEFPTVMGDRSGGGQAGTSVLLPLVPPLYKPKVFICGGGYDVPTSKSAEIIDLSTAMPTWERIDDMTEERHDLNSTLLPDGKVLVTGGVYSGGGAAEIYDPVEDAWEVCEESPSIRGYHSSAILLPDGSVLSGGDPESGTTDLFKPAYMAVPRPDITTAPASITYGSTFDVDSPDADMVEKVILMLPGAVTHSFNQSQRLIEMEIKGISGNTITVTAPPDGNVAPPTWYMLFIVTNDRVPSVASWVQLS